MELVNGVRIYEGKLDSISSGQSENGAITTYGLIEIGDDAPSNVKVINGLDGKLRSSVGKEVKMWVEKKGVLLGLETEGKTYLISRSSAGPFKTTIGYVLMGVVALAWLATFAIHWSWSGAAIGGTLAVLPYAPRFMMQRRVLSGLSEVQKSPGKKIEVSG